MAALRKKISKHGHALCLFVCLFRKGVIHTIKWLHCNFVNQELPPSYSF
jgi:hypothetical protein